MRRSLLSGLLLILYSHWLSAEVTDAASNGFTTVSRQHVDATPEQVWAAATQQVGAWWSDAHTISGDAGNMTIDTVLQGCFCETLGGDNGVVHLTVTFVSPQKLLRLSGGLGPLGLAGVNGNMTWEFEAAGAGTEVTFTYVVGGYYPQGLDSIAPAVDGVIAEALLRMKTFVETGEADPVAE